MSITSQTAAVQAAVVAIDALLADVASHVADLDRALLARRDAINAEFAAAGVPARVAQTVSANADRDIARVFLHSAAEPLLRLIEPSYPRINPVSLPEFSARLARLQAATMGHLA